MVRFPQFVFQRPALRQGQSADHPDADALTALAEQRLSARERSHALDHLAQCPECREVLALASAADANELGVSSVSAGNRKRSWAHLAWALPAVVACLLFSIIWIPSLIRKSGEPSPRPAYQAHPSSPPLSSEEALLAPPEQASPEQIRRPAERPRADIRRKASELHRKFFAPAAPIPEKPISITPPSIVDPAEEAKTIATSAPLANPDVITTAFVDQPSPATLDVAEGAVARQKTFRGIRSAALARIPAVHEGKRLWSLGQPTANDTTSTGIIWTSSDRGKTWQTVHVDDHARFYGLSSDGTNIWVGGVGGALFHSVDNGLHWTPVLVDDGVVRLTGTITGIEVTGENSLKLSVQSGPPWQTTDAGLHWRRE